jgi:hypothetical protein
MTRHLLHVGYPKTGSTYLQRWFEAHPQLAFADGGIAGFRSVYAIAREAATGRADPLVRVTSLEGLTAPGPDAGGMSVDYAAYRQFEMAAAQSRVCSTLGALFPGAMVLIVTRGFRSVILSALSQYARSGGDVDVLQLTRSAGWDRDFATVFHYDRVIGEYERTFGTGNVLVLPYELLRDDADAFLRALTGPLGVEPLAPLRERVNESLSPIELHWYPRITRFVRKLGSPRLFETYIAAAQRNRLRRGIALLQRLRPGVPITADSIPDELVNAFRGLADSLRGRPLYAPYASEYLFANG